MEVLLDNTPHGCNILRNEMMNAAYHGSTPPTKTPPSQTRISQARPPPPDSCSV